MDLELTGGFWDQGLENQQALAEERNCYYCYLLSENREHSYRFVSLGFLAVGVIVLVPKLRFLNCFDFACLTSLRLQTA